MDNVGNNNKTDGHVVQREIFLFLFLVERRYYEMDKDLIKNSSYIAH
jgi:hypothetical protein